MALTQDSISNDSFGLYSTGSVFIGGLLDVIDALPEESHRISFSKTEFPIETGGSMTDNAGKRPDVVTLEGWVSNLLVRDSTKVLLPDEGRGVEAWGRIRDLAELREPLQVVTRLQTYDNMLITSIAARKNKDTGQALIFTITLEETLIAETQLTLIPPAAVPEGSPAENNTSEVNGGRKQSIAPSETQLTSYSDRIRITS